MNDPKRYRRMCEPFPSLEATQDAITAFFNDVEAAREKHRIADVILIAEVVHEADNTEVRGSSTLLLGDSTRALPILAREYGRHSQLHEDMMAKLTAGARKRVRESK